MTRRTSLRKRLIVFLAAQIATPGCLFVPKTVEHRELVRDERGNRTETTGMIVFAGRSQGSHVQARAFVRQACTENGVHVYERTLSKDLDLEVEARNDAWGMLLFLPITVVSLIVSGIVVGASRDEHDVVRDGFGHTHDCSHPLGAARVVGLLPSGETTIALTDEDGVAWFDMPSDAPAGTLIVSLADHKVAPVTISYGQPALVFACATGDCEAQWNAQAAPPMSEAPGK